MKVRYFTPSNLSLSPTSSQTLPLLKMDSEISDKIHVTVTEILNSSDIDNMTEQQVRHSTSQKLGIDLSDLPYKILIRQIIESFLLSTDDSAIEEQDIKPIVNGNIDVIEKEKSPDSCRVICKLSQKRDVAVRSCEGKKVVTIGELSGKDDKAIPTPKCISLSPDQWSIMRKNIPAIKEAIAKVESRLRLLTNMVEMAPNTDVMMHSSRSKNENKQPHNKCDISANGIKQNGSGPSGAESVKKDGANHRSRHTTTRESTVASTPQKFVPIEIIRFDGTNYLQWAERMEPYLIQLKVAYVLSEPCPSAVGVKDSELTQTLSAAEKWTNDDHICRQNILNSLCDNLLGHYSKISGTAKDLWEELKLIYLHEEHGAKVSLVKKYIEFQIVEEKPIFEQVHEFNQIADALIASGMYVEEKFHSNVIISKLPPTWKPFSIELMKEDPLPIWKLMNHVKAAEESLQKGSKVEAVVPRVDLPVSQQCKKLGLQKIPMKKPGFPHASCELDRGKIVKFCNICKKKGHNPEQCWFRKADTNEKDNVTSANGAEPENTSELDRDKAVKFCSICKKKGHNPEQCWFQKPGGKDTTNGKDNVTSANGAVTEEAAGPNTY